MYLQIAKFHLFHQMNDRERSKRMIVFPVCLCSLRTLYVEFRNEAEPSVTPRLHAGGVWPIRLSFFYVPPMKYCFAERFPLMEFWQAYCRVTDLLKQRWTLTFQCPFFNNCRWFITHILQNIFDHQFTYQAENTVHGKPEERKIKWNNTHVYKLRYTFYYLYTVGKSIT